MTMVFTQSMTSVTKVTKWWNLHPGWDQHRVESFHTPSLSIGLTHDQNSRDCTNVVFALQWLFFPKCDFYGSHKQKQQALFDLFKKYKTTSNTSQPAFERNHLGAKGKISASQELRWWGWTRLCWPHAAASCVEATSGMNQDVDFLKWMKFSWDFLVLRIGGYGWLSLVIFPGIGIHFHWAFRLWLWTTNLNHPTPSLHAFWDGSNQSSYQPP